MTFSNSNHMPWFAVRVKSRHEKTVSNFFTMRGIESFLPLHKAKQSWSDRKKYLVLPMFPGYVFCRMDPHVRVPVLSTPGVFDIVGGRYGNATVDEQEIVSLQKVTASNLSCEPYEWLTTGESVLIDEGPLTGVTGKIVTIKGGKRLVLSVTILQRSVLVEIDREWAISLRMGPPANARDIAGVPADPSGLRQL